MSFDAFLLKIDGLSKMFFIIDHFEVIIMSKAIGGINMLFFLLSICNFELYGMVDGGKACYFLKAGSDCFLLLSKVSDRFVLAIPISKVWAHFAFPLD
jgi:hypothetical protein